MADTTGNNQAAITVAGLLVRPRHVLQGLPPEYRWEFTRRHPYYLINWEPAHRFHAGDLRDPREQDAGRLAVMVLLMLGVSADPPPPTSGPDALGIYQLASAWVGGAVAPVTLRGLANLLLAALPAETRRLVGQLLLDSAASGENEGLTRFDAMIRLTTAPDEALDLMPDGPVIGINVHAPQRAISEAVEQVVRDWKQRLEIPERRRRDEVLADYLAVWDLREGWVQGRYDVREELPFKAIAARLSVPLRTVADRYYTAFRLISGQKYSFENWARLFIIVKLAGPHGVEALLRRKTSSPERQSVAAPVPESVLRPGGQYEGRGSSLADEADTSAELGGVELIMDVEELIGKGRSDEQIVRELEFEHPEAAVDLIQYIRRRQHESDRTDMT
jgi:hypothetical protein